MYIFNQYYILCMSDCVTESRPLPGVGNYVRSRPTYGRPLGLIQYQSTDQCSSLFSLINHHRNLDFHLDLVNGEQESSTYSIAVPGGPCWSAQYLVADVSWNLDDDSVTRTGGAKLSGSTELCLNGVVSLQPCRART